MNEVVTAPRVSDAALRKIAVLVWTKAEALPPREVLDTFVQCGSESANGGEFMPTAPRVALREFLRRIRDGVGRIDVAAGAENGGAALFEVALLVQTMPCDMPSDNEMSLLVQYPGSMGMQDKWRSALAEFIREFREIIAADGRHTA